jgi:hypothetical protein
MDNPETLATLGIKHKTKINKATTQKTMSTTGSREG